MYFPPALRIVKLIGTVHENAVMPSANATVVESQLRRARTDLEEGLRAFVDKRTETLLDAYPALAADQEAALELVYTEFVLREQLGQNPDPDDWYRRFPHWKADLEQMFEVHRELKKEDSLRKSRAATVGFPALPETTSAARRIGEFEILGELGRGGMGVVYKARQPSLGRTVAVKVILAGAHAGTRERERFRREAETAARLDHSNIVRIYEVGEHDGRAFCAMEFVDGAPLSDLLDGRPWPPRKAAELIATIAAAAQHAHENGVVHRDLKPGNILLVGARKEGSADRTEPAGSSASRTSKPGAATVKIVDFGLAKSLTDTDPGPTRTGDIIGTPTYMAPEQADPIAQRVGPPTDVWAMGVTLYELLVGHPPFRGDSSVETLQQVREAEPVPPRRLRPTLPRDLDVICLKCLRKKPADRYPTAADLADDLGRFLNGEPIRARPVTATEHLARWCRRNPAVSSLVAVLVALLIAGPIVFAALWLDARAARTAEWNASRGKDAALMEKEGALRDKDAAIETLEHQRYGAQVAEARQEMDIGAAENAFHILAGTQPRYRHLEWDFLSRVNSFRVLPAPAVAGCVPAVRPDGKLIAWVEGNQNGTETRGLRLSHQDLPKPNARPVDRTTHRVQIRRLPDHEVVREWSFDAGRIMSVSFADRGRRLVVTADDPALSVWEVDTGNRVHHLPRLDPPAARLIPSPCADVELPKYLTSLSADGKAVLFWDALSGRPLETCAVSGDLTVMTVVPSPDQETFTVSCQSTKTKQFFRYLCKVGDRKPANPLGLLRSLYTYDPTGRLVVTQADGQDLLAVMEAKPGGKTLHHLRTEGPISPEVAVSRDGRYVAACQVGGGVLVWDLADTAGRTLGYLKPTRVFAPVAGRTAPTVGVQLTDAGELAVIGQNGSKVTLFAVAGGGHRDLTPDPHPRENVPAVVSLPVVWFHPDGRTLFAAGPCGFDLWDTTTGRSLHADRTAAADMYGSELSADGSKFLVSRVGRVPQSVPAKTLGILEVWAVDPPRKLWEERTPEQFARAARFHPDGGAVTVVYSKGEVVTFDAGTGDRRATSRFAEFQDVSLAVSPDAAAVYWMHADPDTDGTRVRVTDAGTGEETRRFVIPERTGRVGTARFLSADRLLCSSWTTDYLQVWDVAAGRWVRNIPGMSGATQFDLTTDGKRIVALGPQHVSVWDADTGQQVLELPAAPNQWQPRGVAVSADGGRIAVVGKTGRVRVWDTGR